MLDVGPDFLRCESAVSRVDRFARSTQHRRSGGLDEAPLGENVLSRGRIRMQLLEIDCYFAKSIGQRGGGEHDDIAGDRIVL